MGWALAIDGCRSNILHTTTNRKQVAVMEGTMKGRCDEQEARGKRNIIVLGALEVRYTRQNTKINSLSLVNNFFLSHLLLRLLNLQINTRPTPPAEFLGDGVAQSIKAVQLDR